MVLIFSGSNRRISSRESLKKIEDSLQKRKNNINNQKGILQYLRFFNQDTFRHSSELECVSNIINNKLWDISNQIASIFDMDRWKGD